MASLQSASLPLLHTAGVSWAAGFAVLAGAFVIATTVFCIGYPLYRQGVGGRCVGDVCAAPGSSAARPPMRRMQLNALHPPPAPTPFSQALAPRWLAAHPHLPRAAGGLGAPQGGRAG